MSYRDSASFGKRQEFIAIAELLRRGFDVYPTLVDDQQIDCVVRLDGELPSYLDIQIKARSRTAKQAATFSAMDIRKPRRNFIFIFYSEAASCYWIMPSLDVVEMANQNKSGKNAGKFSLNFANQSASGEWRPRPKWDFYMNNFDLICDAAT